MHLLVWIYFFIRVIMFMFGLWMNAAGGLMGKWDMMKWAMDKHHDSHKSISFSLKPITIPIPLPLPIPIAVKEKGGSMKAKGDTMKAKGSKPWKAESKDMFWKMMMLKMVMDKGSKKGDKAMCCPQMAQMAQKAGWPKKGGDKKAAQGSMMCCPQMQMNGMNGWPMMKAKMKSKAAPAMMCCPEMMMNGGWSNGAANGCNMMMMMKGGWPSPMDMCCQTNGGGGGGWWPDEEEEEDEDEDYYEEEEPMMGWDTMNMPVLEYPSKAFIEKLRRKGDSMTQSPSTIDYGRDRLYNKENRLRTIFRKGARNFRYNFENDFD